MRKFINTPQVGFKGFNKGALVFLCLALVSECAFAQSSTKGTLVNIFNWFYSMIGVAGGIVLLILLLNAKAGNFLGVQDPRKSIITTLMYTAMAFSVVGIIQLIKTWLGSTGGDISSVMLMVEHVKRG